MSAEEMALSAGENAPILAGVTVRLSLTVTLKRGDGFEAHHRWVRGR